jgi:hypothetical protein
MPRRLSIVAARRRTGPRYLGAMLVGNVVWETLHLPLYTLWETGTARYLAFVVIHCSVGDLMIATMALCAAVLAVGRGWPWRNYGRVALLTILLGLAYTIFSEWLNISVRGSWAYAPAMPLVPVLGTGLSPTLQWILLPLASFMWARAGEDVQKDLGRPPRRQSV